MFLNIITPCTRPHNLKIIEHSINIPRENYRWFIVFDNHQIPSDLDLPINASVFSLKDKSSKFGNAQRNLALSLIDNGYIYMNDDDTTLHAELWDNIKNLDNDFISFKQINKDGSLRLSGQQIKHKHIDSHNFIVHKSIAQGIYWKHNKYAADAIFAIDCYNKSKNSIYLPKVLSVYNSLK